MRIYCPAATNARKKTIVGRIVLIAGRFVSKGSVSLSLSLYLDLSSERADTSGTALARTSSNSKLQTRLLVREDATKYQTATV
jgi:hypothetical protein